MSQNSSVNSAKAAPRHHRWWFAVGVALWVFLGFIGAQLIVIALAWALRSSGISLAGANQAVLNTITAALVYALAAFFVIGLPWWIKKRRTSRADLGLQRLPSWLDIGLAPAGFVVYFLASSLLIWLITHFIPSFNADQLQNVGFEHLIWQYEYILAFVTLVVIAPFVEETLFRGYLYGRFRRHLPLWAAMLLTSLLFAFIHGQWNVAVDVFALSLIMCSLREVTGSIWAGILLHMIKNGLAFYFLFINPSLLSTMGG